MDSTWLRDFPKRRLPFIIATGGEFIALFFWFRFFNDGRYILATIVLFAGFLTERLAVLYWVKVNFGAQVGITGQHKTPLQRLVGLLAITVSEIFVWMAFFLAADHINLFVGGVILFIGEQLQHSWDLALLNGKRIADYLVHPTAIVITVIEVSGGIALYHFYKSEQALLAGGIILVALAVEHVVQGGMIAPSAPPQQGSVPAQPATT